MPDSSSFLFRRKKNDTEGVFKGNQDWHGKYTEDGRRFNAWSPSGCKISWFEGKITEVVTSGGQKLQYQYNGNVVATVRAGSSVILETELTSNNDVKGFLVNGKRIAIKRERKPEVQVVAGNPIIGEISQSLSEVQLTDTKTRKYDFTLDALKLLPDLKISENGGLIDHYSWDPLTRFILLGNDWKYQVTSLENEWGDVAIKRIKSDGKTEFWSYDAKKGQITTEKDGNKTSMSKFLSGPAKHNIRKIKQARTNPGEGENATKDVKFSYDASGKLLRIIGDQFELRALDGTRIEFFKQGKSKAVITQLPDDLILWEDADLKGLPLKLSLNTVGPWADYLGFFYKQEPK